MMFARDPRLGGVGCSATREASSNFCPMEQTPLTRVSCTRSNLPWRRITTERTPRAGWFITQGQTQRASWRRGPGNFGGGEVVPGTSGALARQVPTTGPRGPSTASSARVEWSCKQRSVMVRGSQVAKSPAASAPQPTCFPSVHNLNPPSR